MLTPEVVRHSGSDRAIRRKWGNTNECGDGISQAPDTCNTGEKKGPFLWQGLSQYS